MNGNFACRKRDCEGKRGRGLLAENTGLRSLIGLLFLVIFVCLLGWERLEQAELLMGRSR